MAATVGATITGFPFPLRHAGIGPFQSSAGAYYVFLRNGSTLGNCRPLKATDPMSAFANAATNMVMSAGSATAIEAMVCQQNGNTIYIFTQIASGAVYFNYYTMDTDTWGLVTSAATIAAASFAPTANATFVSAVYRPTATELVLAYCAGLTAMNSGFNMVRYARVNAATGAVIGSVANVDNGGSINWTGGIAALGASDRVHFFISDATNGSLYQRTLTAANALQTFPAAFVTSGSTSFAPMSNAVSYVSGATTKVRAGVAAFTGAAIRDGVAMLDSSDAPTATAQTAADATNLAVNQQRLTHLAVDGTTLHLLVSDASADLWHDTSTDGGTTWGTDVNELTATINRITSNVYSRAGVNRLAMVLDDAGTVKYAEVDLAAGTRLTTDLDIRWKVASRLTQDADLRWKIYARLNQSADLRFRVLARDNQSLDLRWKVYARLTQDADLRWKVAARLAQSLDLRFRVLSRTDQSVDLRWAIYAHLTQDADLRWRVAARLQQDADLRWAVEAPTDITPPDAPTGLLAVEMGA